MATEKLIGKKLLNKIESLRGSGKKEKAIECGYTAFDKNGKEKVQLREFLIAIAQAKGILLEEKPVKVKGRRPSEIARVQKNGGVSLGKNFVARLNLAQGDRLEVKFVRGGIRLVPIKDIAILDEPVNTVDEEAEAA